MVLPSFVKLKKLDLSSNHIGDAGAEALATALPSLGSLQELGLALASLLVFAYCACVATGFGRR